MRYILFVESHEVKLGEVSEADTPGDYCRRIAAKWIGDREYRTKEEAEAELLIEWNPRPGTLAFNHPTRARG